MLEDDKKLTVAACRLLTALHHEIVPALTVEEARAAVLSHDPHLAIIDLGLQDGEFGNDFLVWLTAERPSIRRIVTSGRSPPAGFVEDPPRQLYLQKPFALQQLAACIDG